jgi:hypothetical protein
LTFTPCREWVAICAQFPAHVHWYCPLFLRRPHQSEPELTVLSKPLGPVPWDGLYGSLSMGPHQGAKLRVHQIGQRDCLLYSTCQIWRTTSSCLASYTWGVFRSLSETLFSSHFLVSSRLCTVCCRPICGARKSEHMIICTLVWGLKGRSG